MNKLSPYLIAGGIAFAAIVASTGAFAGTVDDELARVDQLLAAVPSQSTAERVTPTSQAIVLRDDAVASLQAGDIATADAQAKLALHELGEDGIPVNADALAYTCIGGCPGTYLPSVSANDIAHGAPATVQSIPVGREWRPAAADMAGIGSGQAITTQTSVEN